MANLKTHRDIVVAFIYFLALTLTASCKEDAFPEVVKIDTKGFTELMSVSVKVKGDIIDLGTGISDYGIYYKTSSKPQEGGTKISKGTPSVTGEFIIQITGLQSGVKYYACAYAEIKGGFVYGGEISFTTLALASLTTKPATAITTSGATLEATISSDGGAAVTDRGFYWRSAANPDTTGTKLQVAGTGTGLIAVNLTGLSPNTLYYYRAYAQNSVGTVFGSRVNFTTSIAFPSVTTTEISSNTGTTALSGGNITSDGGSPITARGVCWGTVVNPTTSLTTKTSDATGTGSFTSSLTGLSLGTAYHARAYATNSAGTSYGQQVSFTTINVPAVATNDISNITGASASGGGNVSDDGGSSVTARGICWSTSENPTTSNDITTDETGTGSFTSSLSDLSPNTVYYVRAYATNSVGTGYGTQVSFTTLDAGQISDIDGNIYNSIQIGTQVWLKENLRTTKFNNGTSIQLVTDWYTWINLYSWGYCFYYNNPITYKVIYGALYNWRAVQTGILCPSGWHVPTDSEWTTLISYLGGESVAGGKLKEIGMTHWNSPNLGATNETNFTALPGGERRFDSVSNFINIGYSGNWWSASQYDTNFAWRHSMDYNSNVVNRAYKEKRSGFSVRCIKD